MKKQKQAFSLIIAMLIVLVTTLLAYTVLEFIYPFSKNIKGVENSVNAYYRANEGVERALYFFKTRKDENIKEEQDVDRIDKQKWRWYKYKTTSQWESLPKAKTGNSPYNNDFNTIAMWDPIQLSIGNGFVSNLSKLEIYFQVPTIQHIQSKLADGDYIMWQIASENGALYAQGPDKNGKNSSLISKAKINGQKIKISDFTWIAYTDVNKTEKRDIKLSTIFSGNWTSSDGIKQLNCWVKKCILTFSIVKELETKSNALSNSWFKKYIPFLEWKITSTGQALPLRYSQIVSEGEFLGFGKKLEVPYPQETANQVLDITVLN